MPVNNDIPTHLNIRLDPKLRYITELAARARGVTITAYVESALQDSFNKVSVNPMAAWNEEPEVRELSFAERMEKFKARSLTVSDPLSDFATALWSEHPWIRLQTLARSFDHLLSDDDRKIWDYVLSRRELKTADGKLNGKLILERWQQIKVDALTSAKSKDGE
ncbi:hypothetical protein [Acidicapsa acidisoli]|uniref:hypothetical protein n=1 Tax=Acidicapsa acidisoli TaxID=1615681 RepID=UPI0021DF8449|nr:hypothetical protein [Acidicapsa acidisoli]